MVGRLVSFWEGPFSEAMLVSGRVLNSCFVGGDSNSISVSQEFHSWETHHSTSESQSFQVHESSSTSSPFFSSQLHFERSRCPIFWLSNSNPPRFQTKKTTTPAFFFVTCVCRRVSVSNRQMAAQVMEGIVETFLQKQQLPENEARWRLWPLFFVKGWVVWDVLDMYIIVSVWNILEVNGMK